MLHDAVRPDPSREGQDQGIDPLLDLPQRIRRQRGPIPRQVVAALPRSDRPTTGSPSRTAYIGSPSTRVPPGTAAPRSPSPMQNDTARQPVRRPSGDAATRLATGRSSSSGAASGTRAATTATIGARAGRSSSTVQPPPSRSGSTSRLARRTATAPHPRRRRAAAPPAEPPGPPSGPGRPARRPSIGPAGRTSRSGTTTPAAQARGSGSRRTSQPGTDGWPGPIPAPDREIVPAGWRLPAIARPGARSGCGSERRQRLAGQPQPARRPRAMHRRRAVLDLWAGTAQAAAPRTAPPAVPAAPATRTRPACPRTATRPPPASARGRRPPAPPRQAPGSAPGAARPPGQESARPARV